MWRLWTGRRRYKHRRGQPRRPQCDLSLVAGQAVFCLFENTEYAEVTIVKEAAPEDGTPFDFELTGDTTDTFSLSDDGSGNNDSITYNLLPGDYEIHEVVTDGWVLQDILCDHGPDTQINTGTGVASAFIQHLAPGDEVTCTFTNEKHGSITVEKEAFPVDDTEFPFVFVAEDFPIPDFFSLQVPSHPSETIQPLEAGNYFIAENIPDGWGLFDLQCQSALGTSTFDPLGSAVGIELGVGDDVTCTYENRETSKITIVKNAAPADGTDFDFTVGGDMSDGFTLDDANPDDNDGVGESVVYDVFAGTYTFTESVPQGWALQNIACIGSANTTVDIGAATATIQVQSGQDATCAFFNVEEAAAEDYIIIEKVTDPSGAVDFDFEVSENNGTPVPFTLDDGELELITVTPNSSYTVTELYPGDGTLVNINCFGGGSPQFSQNDPGVTLTFGPAGNEVAWCTFTNTLINACPVQDPNVGNLVTDLLGTGQAGRTRKLTIPNYRDVDSVYGQLAAVDVGIMKYVRFRYPNGSKVQISTPTSPAYRTSAVNWWGSNLSPDRFIKGQFFWGKKGNRSPRAFVLWPTYTTTDEFANVFQTFDDSSTNHVYWNTAEGWIPEQTQVLSIPETQIDDTDIQVQVALVDNNKDARPVVLTITTRANGVDGVSQELVMTGPDAKNILNLVDVTLYNVPIGTDEIVLHLVSPGPFDTTYGTGEEGGDSVAMIGAAANYECIMPLTQ
ncbi:MAG: hypothetical protein R3C44_15405 [Chloroflexota bacterium]